MQGRMEAALGGMEALRATVQRKVNELNAMSLAELKVADVAALQRELGKAVTQALVEEGKVADALRIERGGDGICFETARVAIGRKLDRIAQSIAAG